MEKTTTKSNSQYEMLSLFSHGSEVCKSRLLRKYSSELIDLAIKEGWIEEIGKNDINDPKYIITDFGKKVRDN